MTENPRYRAYEVRNGTDYASWIGQVVLIRVADSNGAVDVSAGTLRGIYDRHSRRPHGRLAHETEVVLEGTEFLLEHEQVVKVWHLGENATTATIQRVYVDAYGSEDGA
jgi:hypothetical protein